MKEDILNYNNIYQKNIQNVYLWLKYIILIYFLGRIYLDIFKKIGVHRYK